MSKLGHRFVVRCWLKLNFADDCMRNAEHSTAGWAEERQRGTKCAAHYFSLFKLEYLPIIPNKAKLSIS